jgi:hypothetical protein
MNRIKGLTQQHQQNNFLGKDLSILYRGIEEVKLLNAKILSQQNRMAQEEILHNLNKAEFKVFSQWGDDGIIQFLVDYLEPENHLFIEFGVENYEEANSRLLMINNCWKGLVMDSSQEHINHIRKSDVYWKYQLEAMPAFVKRNNINNLLQTYLKGSQADLMIIDIDGNDYWIWDAIDVTNPTIVIVEYNSIFGCDRAITIPYKDDFFRTKSHYSNLYYGASLPALFHLAQQKGYQLIACNSNGNNAYFVRADKMKKLKALAPSQAFRAASFRESRTVDHQLSYLNVEAAQQLLSGLPVYNVMTGKEEAF